MIAIMALRARKPWRHSRQRFRKPMPSRPREDESPMTIAAPRKSMDTLAIAGGPPMNLAMKLPKNGTTICRRFPTS